MIMCYHPCMRFRIAPETVDTVLLKQMRTSGFN